MSEPDQEVNSEWLSTEYQEVREEFRQNSELTIQRVSKGITAIGFIVAYGLLAEGGILIISTVPIVLAILLIMSIQSGIVLRLLGERSKEIEAQMDQTGWEHFLEQKRIESDWKRNPLVNWLWFPSMILYFLAGVIYIGSLFLSLGLIHRRTDPLVFWSAVLGYVCLTVLIGLSLVSYFRTFSEDHGSDSRYV